MSEALSDNELARFKPAAASGSEQKLWLLLPLFGFYNSFAPTFDQRLASLEYNTPQLLASCSLIPYQFVAAKALILDAERASAVALKDFVDNLEAWISVLERSPAELRGLYSIFVSRKHRRTSRCVCRENVRPILSYVMMYFHTSGIW